MPHSAPSVEESELEDDPDPSGLVGRTLGERYRVTGLLGVGGIGRVYRAEHVVLGREVALKVLLEHYACIPDLQRRFEREAMALAALSHPNIVTITDFVATKEVTFLVMELVAGQDLDDVIEDGLATEDALSVMEQILSCLAYAHESGVIHRDLKPQNVLVRELPGGRKHAVVLDFGLAKFMDADGKHANLTKTGHIVGTPAYMAPEQASGGRADKRSDVYTCAIMLFEMLTGALPFDGDKSDVLRQHLLKAPPTLAEACPGARVAPELEAFIAQALAKDTSDRQADAGAMLEAFLALPERPFAKPAVTQRARADRIAANAATHLAVPKSRAKPVSLPGPARRRRSPVRTALRGLLLSLLAVGVYFAFWPGARDVFAGTRIERALSSIDASGASDLVDEDEAAEDEAVEDEAAEDEAVEEEAVEDEEDSPESEEEPPEEAADPSLDEEADAPIPEEEEAEDPPPPVVRVAARNPWRGRTPATLARIRQRVERNQAVTKRQIRQVARYRTAHPSDVRATLVLAHAYAARGWVTSSLRQYRHAYRRDPSSRGDPRMRRDLIRFAATESLHAEATAALVEIYGGEARGAVERAAARERDADDRRRLRATLARLRAR